MSIKEQIEVILKQEQEGEVIEFKEAKNNYDFGKLGQYFSALSNEANLKKVTAAWLIFGVKDNKTIVGTQFRVDVKKLQNLKLEIGNFTTGNITFKEIHELQLEGKRVLVFEIPPTPKGIPTAFKGHYYARAGESLVALSIEKQERIRFQSRQEDWSAQIIEEASLEDLDKGAILKAREEYKTKHPSLAQEIEQWEDKTFLNKAKITIKGKITNAAIILLGKPEAEHLCQPATTKISWILKTKDNIERDYEHFFCPLLLAVPKIFNKIRNLKYRYLQHGTIFPEELDMYEPYVIREALHNCIAHQDYQLGERVLVVENEDGQLIFSNAGSFLPGSVENVIKADAPESFYRNQFLVNAMVELGMIDTIGSGIKKMFTLQKERLFPLPDYELEKDTVKVVVTGKVIDLNYTQQLLNHQDLDLMDIILLDRVAKKKDLNAEQARRLRRKKLIEGRKPNLYVSAIVATISGKEEEYTKSKGLDDSFYCELIMSHLENFKEARLSNFIALLEDKLPTGLDESQKENKVRNLLKSLKKEDKIMFNVKKYWVKKSI